MASRVATTEAVMTTLRLLLAFCLAAAPSTSLAATFELPSNAQALSAPAAAAAAPQGLPQLPLAITAQRVDQTLLVAIPAISAAAPAAASPLKALGAAQEALKSSGGLAAQSAALDAVYAEAPRAKAGA